MKADEPNQPTEGNEASSESTELTDEAFEALTADLRDPADVRYKQYPRPSLELVSVLDLPSVIGKRLVVVARSKQSGKPASYSNLRAASEVFTDDAGSWIRIAEEWRWYMWVALPEDRRPPMCPRSKARPTVNVWVDPLS
jgi:hypothetical protein